MEAVLVEVAEDEVVCVVAVSVVAEVVAVDVVVAEVVSVDVVFSAQNSQEVSQMCALSQVGQKTLAHGSPGSSMRSGQEAKQSGYMKHVVLVPVRDV